MTFEQMERTMQFILDQQARVDTTLGVVGEKLDKISDHLAVLTADQITTDREMGILRDEIREVKEVAIAHNQAIHRLGRAQEEQMKLHEQHRESFNRMDKRHEQHRESFDRINALLDKAGERIERIALIVERQTNGSS